MQAGVERDRVRQTTGESIAWTAEMRPDAVVNPVGDPIF